MAKGVSGALTRLAKITAVSPLRNGAGEARTSSRAKGRTDDEDEAIFTAEDLEDLAARQYVRRRNEPAAPRPPAAAPPPPAFEEPEPAFEAAAEPEPVYAESPRPRSGRGVRVESADFERPGFEPEEFDERPPAGRGRIAERIRRIKTSLAARVGSESEPEPAARDRVAAKPAPRARALDDDEDDEPGRAVRGSWRPKQLARVRRRLGMTQAEFARCFGLATDDVVRWEAGARPGRGERVLLILIMHDPEEMARLVDEAMPLN